MAGAAQPASHAGGRHHNRDHTASDWTTDDPQLPGVDIGEWLLPVRTERSGVPHQARYRASQSFPGIFNDDQVAFTLGRQPSLGNGELSVGGVVVERAGAYGKPGCFTYVPPDGVVWKD